MGSPGPRTARLFLALWPAAGTREALAGAQAAWTWPPRARLVPPARLHVTLHFLGAVPVERVVEFRDALSVPFDPFVLHARAGACRVWPGGIAVLEFDEVPPALLRLHAALAAALRGLGWPVEERRFRPHVTFARQAQGARPPPDGALDMPPWVADGGYALVQSAPGRGYEVLHGFHES